MRTLHILVAAAILPASLWAQGFAESRNFPDPRMQFQPAIQQMGYQSHMPAGMQQGNLVPQQQFTQQFPLQQQQIMVSDPSMNAPVVNGYPGNATTPNAYNPPPLFSDEQHAAAQAAATAGGGGEANDNGTNPAQNSKPSFIFVNEYFSLLGSNKINTNYLRFKYPILDKQGNFLLEIPFTHYSLVNPTNLDVGGLADIKAQITYNFWTSEDKRWTAMWFNELYIPTADNVLLGTVGDPNNFVALSVGTGKFVFGQGLGFVYAIQPNFILAPIYFYERSFAGSPEREDIHRGKFRFFMMYAWESGLYMLPEFQVATNFITGNNDVYLAPEFGYSTKGITFYAKPGVGLRPDINDRSYGVELGVRILY